MSKRSGMSRLEDLRHWFVDVGRYRFILRKFDMETWRDKTCQGCGQGFTSEPRLSYMSRDLHGLGCMDTYLANNPPEDDEPEECP